jgi:hypothetical protein
LWRSSVASRRVLRLALGTAVSLWISQAVGWSLSYIAPVVTLFLLAMPVPRPQPRFFVVVVLAITVSVYGSFVFLPLLLHQTLVGLLLLALALFHSFYFTARGGPAPVGTLITIGLAMTVAVGSISVDALLAVARGLTFGAIAGAVVALLAHVFISDPPAPLPPEKTGRAAGNRGSMLPADARRRAMRSLGIVLPIAIWFLLSSASANNAAVMIKVAAMGQEASAQAARDAARSLITSTFVGGTGAVIAWQLLQIWPSLALYTLLIGLAGLLFGQQIFKDTGLRPNGATWSYGFLTMIVILAPAVLDGDFGNSAGARFYDRLFMFLWATLYGVGAVFLFEAFWPGRQPRQPQISTN